MVRNNSPIVFFPKDSKTIIVICKNWYRINATYKNTYLHTYIYIPVYTTA